MIIFFLAVFYPATQFIFFLFFPNHLGPFFRCRFVLYDRLLVLFCRNRDSVLLFYAFFNINKYFKKETTICL